MRQLSCGFCLYNATSSANVDIDVNLCGVYFMPWDVLMKKVTLSAF